MKPGSGTLVETAFTRLQWRLVPVGTSAESPRKVV